MQPTVLRSSMTLYSDGASHYSHRVRIVVAEKGVATRTVDVDLDNVPEDLASLNPYNSLPTLVDRDLVVYDSSIIMEYLDERFPHPPLFPTYPVTRAHTRMCAYRVQRDWCPYVDQITAKSGGPKQLGAARQALRESILSVGPIFAEKKYFMSDEFTLADCYIAPILWRLPLLKIDLGSSRSARYIAEYRDRLFERRSLRASLSELEKEMV